MDQSEREMLLAEREGNDITASDMVVPPRDSDLLDFYKHSKVFITGATGYLGKLCMEKLLRACDIDKIYVLVRPKKGKDTQKRFEELFDVPTFDPLKRNNPDFTKKIHLISGDATLPELGISKEDQEMLVSEVDCVFHFAATVRFDEKIRTAANINVKGVRELLTMAKRMKHLKAIVHVSTAYSNCIRKTIAEKFYDPPMTADQLISLLDSLGDEKLDAITPELLGKYPNTYTFTKCIAENIVKEEGKHLPIAVFRPSIVVSTAKEPVAGYIDNIYGPTGIVLGVGVGLVRVINGNKNYRADIVPADFVTNGCLAVAWEVATMKTLNENKEHQDAEDSRNSKFEKDIPVYNYVCTPEKPITWDTFHKLSMKEGKRIPSEKIIWYADFRMIENKFLYTVFSFLLHTVPAYLVDFVAYCIGKKGILVKTYGRINKMMFTLSFFCLNEWTFENDNMQSLWKRLKPQDKDLFDFNLKSLDWTSFFHIFIRGARVYGLKDPLDTVPRSRPRIWKLFVAHQILRAIILFSFFKVFMFFFGLLFR